MDVTAFRAAVRARGGFNSNDALLTDANLLTLINNAVQEYASEAEWPYLWDTWDFQTVVAQAAYALPALGSPTTVAYELRSLIVDGEEYPKVSIVDIDAGEDGTLGWDIYEGQLVISPVPAAIWDAKARVRRFEELLVNATDTPLAPDPQCQTIIDLATSFAHDTVKDAPRALGMVKSYERRLPKDKKAYLDQRTGPRRIRVRPGFPL